jgi:D-alanine-D-alanine ligase
VRWALSRAPGVRVLHRSVLRPSEVTAAIGEDRPHVIFNLCEALNNDARLEIAVAWMLERLGLPFTGSPHHALRHCLHKYEASLILRRAGVPVPATFRVDGPDQLPEVAFPVIVKPEREDGSLCIEAGSVVFERRTLRDRVAHVIEVCRQPALVQRYVHGREISVSLLGGPDPRVLPLGEISFSAQETCAPRVLTFSSKWHESSPEYQRTPSVAAVLRPAEARRFAAVGRRAFDVLGLRDYGRVDLRVDELGRPFVIDVNPNCDVSPEGGLSLAAQRAGLSYEGLVWEILRSAIRRGDGAFDVASSRGRRRRPTRAPRRPALLAESAGVG